MEHSKNFELYKKWYKEGHWDIRKLRNVTAKGQLTPAEYTEIKGEDYPEPNE